MESRTAPARSCPNKCRLLVTGWGKDAIDLPRNARQRGKSVRQRGEKKLIVSATRLAAVKGRPGAAHRGWLGRHAGARQGPGQLRSKAQTLTRPAAAPALTL